MEGTAPLRLPGGRTQLVWGDARDLSVFGALRASDGVWEPHVTTLFETVVQPDWVCLDIGANIGAHTLTLASLCAEGQVVAFEASTVNAGFLTRNIAGLLDGAGPVLIERLALSDRPGQLHLAMFDQLAGCAFLSERGPEQDESLIRAVVDAPELRGMPLGVTSDPVTAVRLDDWLQTHPLKRLDLVKIDVEGAETRVLAGAMQTLQRFKPAMVTEYNPSCATTYWGQDPADYFHVLQGTFDALHVIEPGGTLSGPLTHWESLSARLASGRGWEDLYCTWAHRGLPRRLARLLSRR